MFRASCPICYLLPCCKHHLRFIVSQIRCASIERARSGCSMQPFPAIAAAELCLAMLLLSLLIASSTADAINMTTSSPCEPAKCGNLTIGYPFWLAGTHPPECGYRASQVACDRGNASLKNSLWMYQILDIFYQNSSLRITNDALLDGTCEIESYFNTSSDLGPTMFNISSVNQELFFLYNCTQSRRHLPRHSAPMRCGRNESFNDSYFWLAGQYKPDDALKPLPANCTVSMMPVLGYAGATAKDYERLIKGGFLLEYTAGLDDCTRCSETGGRCRVNVTYDKLECQCPDGVSPGLSCGQASVQLAQSIFSLVLVDVQEKPFFSLPTNSVLDSK